MINDTIFVGRFKSDRNRRSNLVGLESESLTIQFQNLYCLSLVASMKMAWGKRKMVKTFYLPLHVDALNVIFWKTKLFLRQKTNIFEWNRKALTIMNFKRARIANDSSEKSILFSFADKLKVMAFIVHNYYVKISKAVRYKCWARCERN